MELHEPVGGEPAAPHVGPRREPHPPDVALGLKTRDPHRPAGGGLPDQQRVPLVAQVGVVDASRVERLRVHLLRPARVDAQGLGDVPLALLGERVHVLPALARPGASASRPCTRAPGPRARARARRLAAPRGTPGARPAPGPPGRTSAGAPPKTRPARLRPGRPSRGRPRHPSRPTVLVVAFEALLEAGPPERAFLRRPCRAGGSSRPPGAPSTRESARPPDRPPAPAFLPSARATFASLSVDRGHNGAGDLRSERPSKTTWRPWAHQKAAAQPTSSSPTATTTGAPTSVLPTSAAAAEWASGAPRGQSGGLSRGVASPTPHRRVQRAPRQPHVRRERAQRASHRQRDRPQHTQNDRPGRERRKQVRPRREGFPLPRSPRILDQGAPKLLPAPRIKNVPGPAPSGPSAVGAGRTSALRPAASSLVADQDLYRISLTR